MSPQPSSGEEGRESDGTLTSKAMASLIVDELVSAGLIEKESFARAVAIAAQEIDVRKSLGDY